MSNSIIKSENLFKEINHNKILHNINLRIEKGKFIALIGPSGSGKTTLLNIVGLMDSFSGELLVLDNEIKTLSCNEKAKIRNENIGFIFQSHLLLPELTVIDNITLPKYLNSKDSFNPYELLERVGLKNKTNSLPKELSCGELQRAAFARAIINKPEIVLADEPTGNLDKANKIKIFDMLKQYSQDYSATIIVASHDEIVKHYADEILTMDDGHILLPELLH